MQKEKFNLSGFPVLILSLLLFNIVLGQSGVIKGTVVDRDTRERLAGANVIIVNALKGAASDKDGNYIITNIKPGFYTLLFSFIGYDSLYKTDIIVKPNKSINIDAQLKSAALSSEAIKVTAGYFSEKQTNQVSSINFSSEEIRRSPGSAGDVSRIVMTLPSIAKVNDQSNSLVVRGGSPVENGFYVDNIEIPNINHFPTQGSSGGPIGILNVDYIKDVNFYSGGFSAVYGNRLSSVMDITFREGNRDRFEGQLDLNFAGFGGAFEGPLLSGKGSWMLSIRRSYLDFIIKAVDLGTSIAPVYGDLQSKIVFDIDPQNKITFLTITGDDHSESTKKVAEENDMTAFGRQDYIEATTGINWRKIWKKSGYSNTSFSWTIQKYDNTSYETGSGYLLRTNHSNEQNYRLRNVNHIKFNNWVQLDFGFEGRFYKNDYNSFYAAYTDILGQTTDDLKVVKNINTSKMAGFFSMEFNPLDNVSATMGLRSSYFGYNNGFHVVPRASLSYKITKNLALNAFYGVYYQELPFVLLTQLHSGAGIKTPRAAHAIIGVSKEVFRDTRLLIEAYQKEYNNFPFDTAQPKLFLIDELYYNQFENFLDHPLLEFNGQAQSRGVELTLQKKMAKDFYGLVAASYSKSRYRDVAGHWRDRVYDNRLMFSVEGGYKPDNLWEFSLRWIYAGGAPYTPFNQIASKALNRAVLDENKINAARYPDYHSLNVRFDRRFYFSSSNMVFYLSVWNAYDRKNVATYFWNQVENKKDVIYQWRMLPIFGVQYEF